MKREGMALNMLGENRLDMALPPVSIDIYVPQVEDLAC
jgi:hypothetical protein